MIVLEQVGELDYEILKVIDIGEEGLSQYCKQFSFDPTDSNFIILVSNGEIVRYHFLE